VNGLPDDMAVGAYHGPGDVRIERRPAPRPGPGEALVRVRACGLCGTDLAKYRHRLVAPGTVLGHEVAGEVVVVGEGVSRLATGDRVLVPHHVPCFTCVYCRHGNPSMCPEWKPSQIEPGGFCEYLVARPATVRHGILKLPDGLGFGEATLAEPLACCLRAVERTGLSPGDSLVVIGAGPAGLLHVQVARLAGAGRVIAVDLARERLDAARRFGADVALNASLQDVAAAVRSLTAGQGADAVITAVGSAEVVAQALDMVRPGGKVNVFAECPPGSRISLDPNLMYHKEITLLGAYSSSPRDLRVALDLIATGRVNARDMISHRMPLARLAEAFEVALRGRDALKVIIEPDAC
jgi:L-iditol 2-dehydrogenase